MSNCIYKFWKVMSTFFYFVRFKNKNIKMMENFLYWNEVIFLFSNCYSKKPKIINCLNKIIVT